MQEVHTLNIYIDMFSGFEKYASTKDYVKGTGSECWLVQNYKEKGSIVHQFTCFSMENHLWKFQPKQTHNSWDMNENMNKENEKNSGFGGALQYSNALTPLS